MIKPLTPEILLPLTRSEAKALLAVAREGLSVADADRRLFREHRRDAALRAKRRLQTALQAGTPQ